MDIATFLPAIEELKRHIDRIFILKQPAGQRSEFLIFPSLYPSISFSKNTATVNHGARVETQESDTTTIDIFLNAVNKQPIHYIYDGSIYELCIVFKPLAINRFLPFPLAELIEKHDPSSVLNDLFAKHFAQVLEIQDQSEMIQRLEQVLTLHLQATSFGWLEAAMQSIVSSHGAITVSELAEHQGVSRQTLNTHFQRLAVRSVAECKRIARFRAASEHFFKSSLTALTYDLDYFDQSHLIRDFKEFTGMTPKSFFSKLNTEPGVHLIWM